MGNSTPGNPECDESLPRAISQTPRDGKRPVCFAQRLRVEQIIAVSNETHIYRSLRYRDKEGQDPYRLQRVLGSRLAAYVMLNAITAFQHR